MPDRDSLLDQAFLFLWGKEQKQIAIFLSLANTVGSARELHKSLDEVLDDVRKQWREMIEIYEPADEQ